MRNGRSVVLTMALTVCCACSGGDKTAPRGGTGPVASISVSSPTSTSLVIGSSLTLTASAVNASGAPLPGEPFVWGSSNPLVATVSSTGVVTGVAAGVALISAAVDSVVGQTAVSVSASTEQLSCANVTPLALNVGDVHQLTGLERSSLCIGGGAGSEYALIAFNASLDTSTTSLAVGLTAVNTVATAHAPSPQVLAGRTGPFARRVPRDVAFEARMRATERRELNPKLGAARAWYARRGRSPAPRRGISEILGVPSTPAVGSLISLNGNATSACGTPQPRGAVIAAVSVHAIVAVDTLTPANGFTAADYQNFAATFDTLIFPIDTLNYGTPSDIDGNGRELLFFSPIVNQLTAPGSGSYVGGFFFSRDLFPVTSDSSLEGCAGSNVGEMFYLPVVDPLQLYNSYFQSRSSLVSQLPTTIVHEFQHLINAGRHIYINPTAERLEESWLDESQSMLAQELLYYRVSGFAPGQKLTFATISTGADVNGTEFAILDSYLLTNLEDVDVYVQTVESATPYNNTENIATLGAGWQFMRYMLDHTVTGQQYTYSRAIDNGLVSGFANVANVFSQSLAQLATTYQSWAVAQYVDGTGLSSNAAYSNPSWNFRDVVTKTFNLGSYPLATRTLVPGSPAAVVLRGGGASYMRFRVNAGVTGQIVPTGNIAAATNVMYALVRTF